MSLFHVEHYRKVFIMIVLQFIIARDLLIGLLCGLDVHGWE
jgi:hypothetical protein